MADKTLRMNLGAAAFPLVSDWMGRSVVVPDLDESGGRSAPAVNEDPAAKEASVPQLYYAHNVMPVGQGFKSIAYRRIIRPPVPAVATFEKMIPIKDPNETKGFMGITSDGRLFMINSGDPTWTEVTSQIGGAGWHGGPTSYAYANGFTYLCLSFYNVYKLTVSNKLLTVATLSGLTNSLIKNITSSSNYLIATDDVTVYWSSASDPQDFVPSLATGAGSGTPQDLNGQIVAALPLSSGFAIYSTTNIIIASYSGNIRYPWIFKQAPNSGGITDIEKVAFDSDGGSNYAWTSSGLLKILPTGCQPLYPEITDFLAGRIFEDFDDVTNVMNMQYLDADLRIKVIFIGSRFLILSYGVTSLTHALLYDTAMKRWGKIKLPHADCFEIILNAEDPLTWYELAPQSWDDLGDTSWEDLTTLTNIASSAKRTIGFLQADGTVQMAVWDYGNFGATAVVILGKYQISRSRLTTTQEFIVETVDPANPTMEVYLQTLLDGKEQESLTLLAVNTLTTKAGSRSKRYNYMAEGDSHSLLFKGSFTLTTVLGTFTLGGYR